MKRKYYLRGLGTGILVTALIMMLTAGQKPALTDEEIKAKAKELGMVESTLLSELAAQNQGQQEPTTGEGEPEQEPETEASKEQTPEEQTPEEQKPVETEEPTPKEGEPEQEPETEASKEQTPEEQTPEEQLPEEQTPEEQPSEEQKSEEVEAEPKPEEGAPEQEPEAEAGFTLVIQTGASSVTVSKALAEAGIVDSADVFDRYLCQNGYDKKIRAGSYQIPQGATEEEIAKIITRR